MHRLGTPVSDARGVTRPHWHSLKLHCLKMPEVGRELTCQALHRAGGSVSVHARWQFRGRFRPGMIAPGRRSKADGMRRMRWGSDFGAA